MHKTWEKQKEMPTYYHKNVGTQSGSACKGSSISQILLIHQLLSKSRLFFCENEVVLIRDKEM